MAEKLAALRARAREQLKKIWKHETLTLRGEIIITRSGMAGIARGDFEQLGLEADIARLKRELPGAKVTVQYGVCDATVRLFAYQTAVTEGVFNRMRDILTHIAAQVYGGATGLSLRLDVLGECRSLRGRQQVRFLNKDAQVAYRLTEAAGAEETPLARLKKKFFE